MGKKKKNRDDWSSGSPSRTCHAVLTLGRQEALDPQQQPAERERVVVLLELLLGLARRGIEGVEEDAAHGSVTRVRINRGHVTEHQRRQSLIGTPSQTFPIG